MVKKISYFVVVTIVLALLAALFVREGGKELDLTEPQLRELERLIKVRLQLESQSGPELVKLDGPSRIESGARRSGFFTYRLVNGQQSSQLVVWWHLEDERVFLDKIGP